MSVVDVVFSLESFALQQPGRLISIMMFSFLFERRLFVVWVCKAYPSFIVTSAWRSKCCDRRYTDLILLACLRSVVRPISRLCAPQYRAICSGADCECSAVDYSTLWRRDDDASRRRGEALSHVVFYLEKGAAADVKQRSNTMTVFVHVRAQTLSSSSGAMERPFYYSLLWLLY